jgi:hypothetical protein
MTESFLILLAGGVMYAAAIEDPKQVTLLWLRLAGIIALAMAGLGMFFLLRRGEAFSVKQLLCWLAIAAILAQLAFVQIDKRTAQRLAAIVAAALAIAAGGTILSRGATGYLSAFGIASMSGLALMDMLLGHAYLTASQMTMTPFRRLNLALAGHLIFRAIVSIAVAMVMAKLHPIYLLWGKYGLFILTRWLVGLAVTAVFIYMAHDCIKRRSTQSATGILYVAGVLIFIGEIISLQLVSETGICF